MIKLYEPAISEDDRAYVMKAQSGGRALTNRKDGYVRLFEESIEKYLGVKHAVAVSSGTAALHLALRALTVPYVYIPAFTFPAVRNMVQETGKSYVTVDINYRTYNMDTRLLKRVDKGKHYAILLPHMFGQSADVEELVEDEWKETVVVEDAACALGAKYKDDFCGTMGAVGCFSFHPRKVITTGEGGMLVTNDDRFAEKFRSWRNHGLATDEVGFNYRMSEVAGALGYSQFKRLDRFIERRRQIAAVYNALFDIYDKERRVITPIQVKDCFHTYQSYVVRIGGEASWVNIDYQLSVMNAMQENGIDTTIGSHCFDYSKHESARAVNSTIALPIHTKMSDDDVVRVVETLLEVL